MSLKLSNLTESNTMATLSDRIKELRLSVNMTQEEFGKIFGIVKSTVSLYESGKSTPNDQIKKQICDYFCVSLDYLLGMDNRVDAISKPDHQRGGYDNSVTNCIARTGLSYEEAAQKLGISEELLMDYIQEKLPIPYKILSALSEICEVSTDCLLGIIAKSRERNFDNILPFRYDYKIAERIRTLFETNSIDTNSSFLENLLSLSSKEIFYLVEYGFVPHMDTIIQLANYFNVSIDYLLCQIDLPEEKVLRSFRQLNEDNKDIIVGEIKKYLREQRYEESVAANETLKRTGTENQGK